MTISLFLFYFTSLFTVLNPFGSIPMFVGLTSNFDDSERYKVALKASISVCIILIISFLLGKYILTYLNVRLLSLKITGGIIIGLSGFSLLSGNFMKNKGVNKRVKEEALAKDDPSLTPIAMPMLAGPGSISYLISLHENNLGMPGYLSVVGMIILASFFTYLILFFANKIASKLGASGLTALARLIGFLVIAIGVEYVLSGVSDFVKVMKL